MAGKPHVCGRLGNQWIHIGIFKDPKWWIPYVYVTHDSFFSSDTAHLLPNYVCLSWTLRPRHHLLQLDWNHIVSTCFSQEKRCSTNPYQQRCQNIFNSSMFLWRWPTQRGISFAPTEVFSWALHQPHRKTFVEARDGSSTENLCQGVVCEVMHLVNHRVSQYSRVD